MRGSRVVGPGTGLPLITNTMTSCKRVARLSGNGHPVAPEKGPRSGQGSEGKRLAF